MKTKHVLEVPYELDYIVLGINSHAKEYKLCWNVNKTLQLDLEKKQTINNKKDLFGRDQLYEKIKIDNSFPDYISENKSKFSSWIV